MKLTVLIILDTWSRKSQIFKYLSSGFQIIRLFVKAERNNYKTTNKSASIHANQILLSSNRLELSSWFYTQVFKKIETSITWNYISKAHFLQIAAEHQDCPVLSVFVTIKTSFQNTSIRILQISLKLQEHRGGYWRKKLPWTILKELFPVPWNTTLSKISNGVISLLWQLRCHCNPDRNKFSSLSSTAVVVIFQIFVNSDVVYAQTWEELTLKNLIEPP